MRPKAHEKSPPLLHDLRWMNPVYPSHIMPLDSFYYCHHHHPIQTYIFEAVVSFLHFYSSKPCMHFPFPPIHAACTAHLIWRDFIAWIIFGEWYKIRSFLLCNFPYFIFLFVTNSSLTTRLSITHFQPVNAFSFVWDIPTYSWRKIRMEMQFPSNTTLCGSITVIISLGYMFQLKLQAVIRRILLLRRSSHNNATLEAGILDLNSIYLMCIFIQPELYYIYSNVLYNFCSVCICMTLIYLIH